MAILFDHSLGNLILFMFHDFMFQCEFTNMVQGDQVDNDCDGSIDEEIFDGKDNDDDGVIDEDLELVIKILKRLVTKVPELVFGNATEISSSLTV